MWDTHQSTLEHLKHTHRDILRAVRAQHDTQNQGMEASLDVILDRLRQASGDEVKKLHTLITLNTLESWYINCTVLYRN